MRPEYKIDLSNATIETIGYIFNLTEKRNEEWTYHLFEQWQFSLYTSKKYLQFLREIGHELFSKYMPFMEDKRDTIKSPV